MVQYTAKIIVAMGLIYLFCNIISCTPRYEHTAIQDVNKASDVDRNIELDPSISSADSFSGIAKKMEKNLFKIEITYH